jgi:plasmid stabilization system protein ParE
VKRVRFVAPAYAQLAEILLDLATKNPRAANRLAVRVDDVVERLSKYPDAFQSVEARPDIRRVPLTPYPYMMFYRVLADEVEVVAVKHGARREPWENL